MFLRASVDPSASHGTKRLQAHKTHEVSGPMCAALGHGEHSQRVVQLRQACRGRRFCACVHELRRVGGSCENSDSADFAHRSSSHVRRLRRRPAAGARGRLVDRVRGTHHVYEMFVRTVQDVIVVSRTLIIRVLRFETSLGFVENLRQSHIASCVEELRRYVEDCHCIAGATANLFCFKGWSRSNSKSKSKETSCDWHCAEKASCAVPDDPEEPSLGELEGPFTLVRRGRISEPQRRGKLPRWVAGQSESCSQQILENVTELRNCLEHERCHYEEGRRSIVAFAGAPGNLFLS